MEFMSAAAVVPVALLVNYIVYSPYMDEVFHIPQAQRYCQLDFQNWDPMITTFPGLYLITLVYKFLISALMHLVLQIQDVCTLNMLRSINVFLYVLCVYLFRNILIELEKKNKIPKDSRGVSIKSLILALYPLHWFFTFLYYTDVGSTAAVMGMYLTCLQRSYWKSAFLSVIAIMFRQTNAVWAVFMLCVGLIQFLQDRLLSAKEDDELVNGAVSQTDGAARKSDLNRKRNISRQKQQSLKRPMGNELKSLLLTTWKYKWEVLRSFLPSVVVILVFIMFVLYNGSIVVGAKEAHKVSPHFAQFLYFALFTAGVLAPFHFTPERIFLIKAAVKSTPVLAFASLTISLFMVHFFSLAHPYLLADNRHYTFYIWKDILQAHLSVKYLLTPVYIYSWWSLVYNIKDTISWSTQSSTLRTLWIFSFCTATAAVLVPAPLVEFRYYTVPFYIIALHTISRVHVSNWKLWFIAVEFVIVNIITMWIFLCRPFTWPHEAGIQRFLW